MAVPESVPAGNVVAADFIDSVDDDDLIYFLCNVGDADAQIILTPADDAGDRRAIIVDAGKTSKLPALIDALVDRGLLPTADDPTDDFPEPDGSIALVVASHPHADHIRGIPRLLSEYRHRIAEFWDPGYYFPSAGYIEMMKAIEANPHILYAQPTSGYRRWIGTVAVTVLSPSIQLRNRFDTYGVEPNNASISLRVEAPAARVVQRNHDREYLDRRNTMSLILGGDAQTVSWSYVLTDFPDLAGSESAAARAIKAASGEDLLSSDILKVSHHGSKHGINLELVERVDPRLTLVSSVGGDGQYRFPHTVAQEQIREALHPTTSSGADHPADWELNVFYTADRDDADAGLGSIAVVAGRTRWTMWRFGDGTDDDIDFSAARRWQT